jgi:hypothetical protein
MRYLLDFDVFEGLRQEGENFKFDFSDGDTDSIMNLKFSSRKRKKTNIRNTECENYYAYTIDNIEGKEFLKSIKYIDQRISANDANLMVNKAVIGFDDEFDLTTYDTIVYPKSSSKILKVLAEQLFKKAGNAKLIPDSFVKLERSQIKFDDEKIETLPEKTKKEVKAVIKRIQTGEGDFHLRTIFSRYRQFIKDFMIFNSERDRENYNAIENKNIILVDDFRTSGTTLKEMKKQLLTLSPKKITVFILIDVI